MASGVGWIAGGIKTTGALYGASTGTSIITGAVHGIKTGNWDRLGHAFEIMGGMFYLDENRNFFDQALQGTTRFSWEILQTSAGYNYSQLRNAFGGVDRVDFLGGATFVTNENIPGNTSQGFSLSNFLNMRIPGKIPGRGRENFINYAINSPLYMHEYGHSCDSQRWGPLYLPAIGVYSAISSANARDITFFGLTNHDIKWYEVSANQNADWYFGKYYGVNWDRFEPRNFGTYPTSSSHVPQFVDWLRNVFGRRYRIKL